MPAQASLFLCVLTALTVAGPCFAQLGPNDRCLQMPNAVYIEPSTITAYSIDFEFADFDGDGRDEVVKPGPSGVEIWGLDPADLSRWVLEDTIDLGGPYWCAHVADLNDDGKLDLACGNAETPRTIRILFQADSGFVDAQTLVAGPAPVFDVVSGDFNGDGVVDLLANNLVYPGIGNGQFGDAIVIDGLLGVSFRVADFNDDGLDDFATGFPNASSGFAVGIAKGAFDFAITSESATFARCDEVALGDFNSDGLPDICFAQRQCGTNCLTIRLSNGDGTFTDLPRIDLTFSTRNQTHITTADFDGDGFIDIALFEQGIDFEQPPTYIGVLYGNEFGSVSDERFVGDSIVPGRLVRAGDMNGDGLPDMVTQTYSENNEVSLAVYLNTGNRSFAIPRPTPTPNFFFENRPVSIASVLHAHGDVTGDGVPDVVTEFGIFENIGDAHITIGNLIEAFGFVEEIVQLEVGDVDQDSVADIVIAFDGSGTTTLLRANGDGTFQPPTAIQIPSGRTLRLADINGDGSTDILAARAGINGQHHIVAALGHGDGTFASTINSPIQSLPIEGELELLDVNSDGLLDIVCINDEDELLLYLSSTPGSFAFSPQVLDTAIAPLARHLIAGDYNGDGLRDVVYFTRTESNDPFYALKFNLGDGTFTDRIMPAAMPSVVLRCSADFNGDGTDDLVSSLIEVAYSNGDGDFSLAPRAAGAETRNLLIDDFNGDGRPDLYDDDGRIFTNVCPAAAPCPADCDASGTVDFNDLVAILFEFGAPDPSGGCDADVSGGVDFNDLVAALFLFGPCP